MAEELLKLENIYKNFGNVKVLKDVNIKINKGEVVALIGDNGAGKSTLIKVITGVHSPNSGKVFFKNEEVQIKSVAQSRKMGIEAVYQERALCDQQELFRNIFAGREITNSFGFLDIKKQRKEAEKILRDYIGFTSKAITVDSQVMGLSGGEKQRVAIARAMVKAPSILFADEPTGNLDQSSTDNILELLLGINQQTKTTLVVVTHDQQLAARSDMVFELQEGKLKC